MNKSRYWKLHLIFGWNHALMTSSTFPTTDFRAVLTGASGDWADWSISSLSTLLSVEKASDALKKWTPSIALVKHCSLRLTAFASCHVMLSSSSILVSNSEIRTGRTEDTTIFAWGRLRLISSKIRTMPAKVESAEQWSTAKSFDPIVIHQTLGSRLSESSPWRSRNSKLLSCVMGRAQ